jgi:hypothetical protein
VNTGSAMRRLTTFVNVCGGLLLLAQSATLAGTRSEHPLVPLATGKSELVAFDISPFPYYGTVPGEETPFLDAVFGERRGHTSPRGGVYWEDQTYSDRRVLLYLPKGFDARRPALIVVFFHGNHATLERDVRDRQQVPPQVAQSGLNAALVAPQFAFDAADSSAGRFWEPGVFAGFLNEAAERLARLYGDERARSAFNAAPLVLVAYSGGYLPAAWSVYYFGADERVRGVVLLDALYGETDKFADWIEERRSGFFLSAYSSSARDENLSLQRLLSDRHIGFLNQLPSRLSDGNVVFLATAAEVTHGDFLSQAWAPDPLRAVLAKIKGFSRAPFRSGRNGQTQSR